MLTITEKIIDTNLSYHAFTEADLEQLFDGSAASRYGLVNKALKKGELIRLRRGLYLLGKKYLPMKISKFYLASRIATHSYISLESALSHHGWIPERVVSTFSIIAQGRTRSFKTPLGEYSYYLIPTNDYEFLTGVNREQIDHQPYLIASPIRALADLVYIRKII